MSEIFEQLSRNDLYSDPGIEGRVYRFVVDNFKSIKNPDALFTLRSRGGVDQTKLRNVVNYVMMKVTILLLEDLRSVRDGISIPLSVDDDRTDGERELAEMSEDDRNHSIFAFDKGGFVNVDKIVERLNRCFEGGEEMKFRTGDLACLVDQLDPDTGDFLMLGEYLRSMSGPDGKAYAFSGEFVENSALPAEFNYENAYQFWYELLRNRFNAVDGYDTMPSRELLHALFHPSGPYFIVPIGYSTPIPGEINDDGDYEREPVNIVDIHEYEGESFDVGSELVVIPYVVSGSSYFPVNHSIMAGKIVEIDREQGENGGRFVFEAKMELDFQLPGVNPVVRRIEVDIANGVVNRVCELPTSPPVNMSEENMTRVPLGGSSTQKMAYQVFFVNKL